MPSTEARETEPLLADSAQRLHDETDIGILERRSSKSDTTDWKYEAYYIVSNSAQLSGTYLLSYFSSLLVVLVVSRLGRDELASVSLATTTMNILGFSIFEGLATALDTLCSQAYGAGNLQHVGLHTQRMVLFLLLTSLPIAAIWICSPWILPALIPQKQLAPLAGTFLRWNLVGVPGHILFEAGKRFVQAQGDFTAALIVSIICAPINVGVQWLFVFKLEGNVAGAALANAFTNDLRPILLLLYILFITPERLKCWQRPSMEVFRDWSPMVWLSIPGALMCICEWGAFEILVFSTSYLGTAHLAAQTLLATTINVVFHVPFAAGVAVSTRIGNLVGAEALSLARSLPKLYALLYAVIALCEMAILLAVRSVVAEVLTTDPRVAELVTNTMPVAAIFTIFDATTQCTGGILRGLGRQAIGAWVMSLVNYCYAVPFALFLELDSPHLGLSGVWIALMTSQTIATVAQGVILRLIDWRKCMTEAKKREVEH